MHLHTGNRAKIIFSIFSLLLVFLFILELFSGSIYIPVKEIIKILFSSSHHREEWDIIVLDFRLTRALAAILSGIALSISGLQMQAVFRNPLAGPDVLGISSGASLGVAVVVISLSTFFTNHLSSFFGNWIIAAAACMGAAAVLLIILSISFRIKDIMSILIIGIMIGAGISALVSILQYFGNETLLKSFVIWTLGNLTNLEWPQLFVLLICTIVGALLSFLSIKNLNALLLGEKYAQSMGMNIKQTRIIVFTSTSLLAGSVTAFCGPIAFIAIAVPHLCRIIFKTSDHKTLWWASVMAGACIMLFCDIIAQLPGSVYTLPINSITSLIGIPIVIWIIVSNRNKSFLQNRL